MMCNIRLTTEIIDTQSSTINAMHEVNETDTSTAVKFSLKLVAMNNFGGTNKYCPFNLSYQVSLECSIFSRFLFGNGYQIRKQHSIPYLHDPIPIVVDLVKWQYFI